MDDNNVYTVIVIGGGLVGCLFSIFMAKKGHQVVVFEYREDIRQTKDDWDKSINMVLSHRGRKALRAVGLEDLILKFTIPIKGRFVHELSGHTRGIPFDSVTGQISFSMNRNLLNKILLTELNKYPNIKIYFNHKLTNVSYDKETVTLINIKTQEETIYQGDLIIGADGAHSTLRRFMQRTPLFELHQTYIRDRYLELKVCPKNGLKLTPNYLHVWPRENFMMVALPNLDQSWTFTLTMPFDIFDSLKTGDLLINFFKNTFPDVLSLIGEDSLLNYFFKVEPSPVISIKCSPYYMGRKFLIVGDAAHATVPYFGQGLNAAFEDCLTFDRILSKNNNDVAGSIQEFSEMRKDDCHLLCKLGMYNYLEMKSLITKRSYHLRRTFDDVLFRFFPKTWVPFYFSVSYSDTGYKKCLENRKWQNKVIYKMFWIGKFFVIMVMAYLLKTIWN